MSGLGYFYCVRFSYQLIICEVAFLIGRPRRNRFAVRMTAGLIAYFLIAFLWNQLLNTLFAGYVLNRILLFLGLVALSMGLIWLGYDLIPIELLFVGSGGYALQHIAFALGKVVLYFAGWSEATLGTIPYTLLFCFPHYVMTAALVYIFLIRKNKQKETFKPYDKRMVILALAMLVAAIILSAFYVADSMVHESFSTQVICPLYGMMCCTLVLLMEFSVLRENRHQIEQETIEQLLQMANAQRKISQETIAIINMKCHDLKHQIGALASMSDDAVRSKYVAEVQQAVSIYDMDYHTGCEALDYVLREKNLLAKERHITFSCMADGTAIAFMNPADIYALMGNALDNALERVSKEQEDQRIVSLLIKRTGNMVLLHLENQCSSPPQFQDGLPITDKEDKNAHGFGVRSICYLVKRYHGEVLMRAEDGTFCLDILMPCKRAEQV